MKHLSLFGLDNNLSIRLSNYETLLALKFLLRNKYSGMPHCKTDKIAEVSNGRFRQTRNINLTCARQDI